MMRSPEYQVGGSLQANHPTYVQRQADTDLCAALQQGEFCYAFNARQMGKSSLLVRTKHQLEQLGWRCAVIDMTCVGSEFVTPEQWYKGLAYELWLGFGLSEQFALKSWWQQQELSYVQRLSLLISQILSSHPTERLLIFVDEVDSVLSLPFPVDDFFGLIRFCYNQRAVDSEFNRISFALFGVATPSDLVRDSHKTPFNIGRAIELQGFQLHEVEPLTQTLVGRVSNPTAILREILTWTNGQPFLTQKLCQLTLQTVLATPDQFLTLPPGTEAFWVENLVQLRLIQNWESQDEPEHLRTIRDRLLRSEGVGRLLGLYQQVWQAEQGSWILPYFSVKNGSSSAHNSLEPGQTADTMPQITPPVTHNFVAVDDSWEQVELLLSGLVVRQQGQLRIKNQIYQRVFDQDWLQRRLAALRPYAQAITAWANSQQQDGSRLLRGQALQDARNWAQGKRLSDLDYQFLAASQTQEQQEIQQALEAARLQEVEARLNLEQRNGRQQRFWLTVVSVKLVIVSVLALVSFRQYQRASLNEVKAIATASETFYTANQSLDALATALRASQKLRTVGRWITVGGAADQLDGVTVQVGKVLRQAVYNASEVNRLVGHQSAVLTVAISPNEQLLASGSEDRTVRLWQRNGSSLKVLYGHSDRVGSLAFSPDGQLIGSGSDDRTVILWNTKGEKLNRLIGHSDRILAVAFSPDSKTIASASQDGTVKLWSVQGNLLQTLNSHTSAVRSLSFSSDGSLIATASDDQTVKVWSRAGRLLKTLRGHTAGVRTVAFSPNNRTIVSGSEDRTVKIWSFDGRLLRTLQGHGAAIHHIAFSPYGQIIASASRDSTIKLWNRDGVLLSTLRGHGKSVNSVAFTRSGRTLASASDDETLRLWAVRNIFLTPLVGHEAGVTSVAFSPSERTLITGSEDNTVRLWNWRGAALRIFTGHQAGVASVAVSPDGQMIASASRDQTVRLWSREGKLLKTYDGHKSAVQAVAFSPNGREIASGSENALIKLWRKPNESVYTLAGHVDAVMDLAFSPISPLLASVSRDGAIRLWRNNEIDLSVLDQSGSPQVREPWRNQGELITSFGDYNGAVLAVAFNPKQQQIATTWEKTVRLWHTDGRLFATLRGHQGRVRDVAFSPDGKLVASASDDRTVKLWTTDGQEVTTLDSHTSAVRAVTFSPDSQNLVSVSDDRTALLWDLQLVLDTGALEQYGCSWLYDYLQTTSDQLNLNQQVHEPDHLCDADEVKPSR